MMPRSQTLRNSVVAANSTTALLTDLIDYAGLFPPASLSMAACVANYDSYLRSQWDWILGRLIIPVARLAEFEDALSKLPNQGTPSVLWRLAVLPGDDVIADVARIREFNARMANGSGRSAAIESIELRVSSVENINRLSDIIPRELETYFEIPLSIRSEYLTAINKSGRRAKIRTGGETADKFPTPENVIEFIGQCTAADVPFKATAGLHHPLRSVHHFTYQSESPSGIMHGFINVFLCAAFLRKGMDPHVAVQLLEERLPGAFRFDSEGIGWRTNRLTREEIATARQELAVSFGSCSFMEPIEDLLALHIL
jgi:hypothetical protein